MQNIKEVCVCACACAKHLLKNFKTEWKKQEKKNNKITQRCSIRTGNWEWQEKEARKMG